MKRKIQIALVIAFALYFTVALYGCYRKAREAEIRFRLAPAQADYVVLAGVAANFNAMQTNWTVLVVPRTNQPVIP